MKRDAQIFAATVEVRKLSGEFMPASAGRITIGELAPDWLAKKQQSTAPSHFRTLESAWRTHVQVNWESLQVKNITTHEVEAWVSKLTSQGYGSTTVRRAHSVLSGILKDAVKGRRLVSNPASCVENLPRRAQRRHVYLTASDVHALAARAGKHQGYSWCWRSAGCAGARPSRSEFAILTSFDAESWCSPTLFSSEVHTTSDRRKTARRDRYQFPTSFSRTYRGGVEAGTATITFSRHRRRVPAASALRRRLVCSGLAERPSTGSHGARLAPYLCVAGCIGWCQRPCAAADAWSRQRQGHPRRVCRPFRRRPRRRCETSQHRLCSTTGGHSGQTKT